MAQTPPLQIQSAVHTPPAPLHGAAYDNLESLPTRYSTRSSQRRTSRELQTTPEAPGKPKRATRSADTSGFLRQDSPTPQTNLGLTLSPRSPPPRKTSRRVQIVSPSSPDPFSPTSRVRDQSNSYKPLFASSTTIMAEGMLPTPVKTPKKKPVPKVGLAARALFQDQSVIDEDIASLSRPSRKPKRYNGFSLESFQTAGDDAGGRIQIFTDSRDKVPEVDVSEQNPFLENPANEDGSSARKIIRVTKRRKLSAEPRKDAQVEEAIHKDEGMVYVFRGKKVFRKYDDLDEDEEVIDTEDLAFLEHTPNGAAIAKDLKPLSRKSIKPTRLFQTEAQNSPVSARKEEEATTDIEDNTEATSGEVLARIPEPEIIDLITPAATRSLRSGKKQSIHPDDPAEREAAIKSEKSMKTSPLTLGDELSLELARKLQRSHEVKRAMDLVADETIGKKARAA